jgi:hypothetical protein
MGPDGQMLAGAKVVSDAQPEGQLKVTGITGGDGAVTYGSLKPGRYGFQVTRFDYEQRDFSVTVAGGVTASVTVTLTKVAGAALVGGEAR